MRTYLKILFLLPLALLLVPSVAAAETGGPQWAVTSVARPTNFKPGSEAAYVVTVTNTGGASANGNPLLEEPAESGVFGEPVTITDELPEGLTPAPGISAQDELASQSIGKGGFSGDCGITGSGSVSCTYSGAVVPDDTLILKFPVDVSKEAKPVETNVVRVAGGGAPSASMETETTISSQPAGFGISLGGATTAVSTSQAGAHPDLTTSIAFNTVNGEGATAKNFKDITDDLPPGFAGDLIDTPTCPAATFLQRECPADTQVGVTTITLVGTLTGAFLEPVYNLAPTPGDVAKIGFAVGGAYFFAGDVAVRSPGEPLSASEPDAYGLKTTFYNVDQTQSEIDNVSLTVWGVPGDPIHNPLRWTSPAHDPASGHFGAASEDTSPVAYFTNPTSCGAGPLKAYESVTSWEHPEESPEATGMEFGPLVGCDRLGFPATFRAVASTDHASASSGLDVNLDVGQTYENAYGLASSTLKKAVVTLPEGMTVNPSAGTGLGACTQAQYEEETLEEPSATSTRGCPSNSTLGSVNVETPVFTERGVGKVFLAQPYANPFHGEGHPTGSLIALYLVIRFKERGVVAKLAGEVNPNPVTGQLTTTFEGVSEGGSASPGLPPVPFSAFEFKFNQGSTAPLVTPPVCGSYQVSAALTPYANPAGPLDLLAPAFPIGQGFEENGPCPAGGIPPFAPQVTAGTTNNDGGAYSPLTINIARNDGEQEITGFASQLPAGLTANLSGVPFCSETQIATARERSGGEEETNPACPAASEIGHTVAEAGVGSNATLAQAPGKLYMAGPFEGAPFSIVSITSAKVGPFDLGTVVVHLPLDINPVTAAVSIPAGPADQIPHIIKGIVIHVRDIRVYVSKQNFTLNPTSCNPATLSATVIGGGANPVNPAGYDPVTVTDPFQAANCASLKFAPKFTASTEAKDHFNENGASLKVNIAVNQGPSATTGQASESNISKVKVELPVSLPSRLTTLQKACPAKTFEENFENCLVGKYAASKIGEATVHTPILPVALTGPAIFVSHGGEAFPSLILVLQGYGVTIDLTGATFISKSGITSSTFKTVPDQPFSSFELTLPTGKYSALAAITNVCKPTKTETVKKKVAVKRKGKTVKVTKKVSETVAAPLLMPTEITAQNGAVLKQSTKIAVTGCKATKPAKKKKAKKKKQKKGKAKKK